MGTNNGWNPATGGNAVDAAVATDSRFELATQYADETLTVALLILGSDMFSVSFGFSNSDPVTLKLVSF